MHIVCKDEYGNHISQLFQWDQNITICIYGLGLSEKPEIHFATRDSDTAYRFALDNITLNTDEDVVSSLIPNDLLWENKQILVYVVTNQSITVNGAMEQRIQSIYMAQIPVKSRAKPSDFTLETNVQGVDVMALKGLLDTLNTKVPILENEIKELKQTDESLSADITDTLTNAKTYTDTVLKDYATQSDLEALSETITTLQAADAKLENSITEALSSAKTYTDTALTDYVTKDDLGDIDVTVEELSASDIDAMFT